MASLAEVEKLTLKFVWDSRDLSQHSLTVWPEDLVSHHTSCKSAALMTSCSLDLRNKKQENLNASETLIKS